ncbi:MAG TPA: hypothetical protein DCG75_10365 [Bacteroidales bacterium]|nr:hypothetical protein [Bacteroidales bacterium]
MALPRGDEYNQAIQSPRISFSDTILQSCQVETTPLGLPKPYSGGFTTTYKLVNSHTSWAVRCFTREISDLQRRYQSIGNFLSTNNCDFLVEANFLQNGIKVNGAFHPIIKMRWLDGEPLSNYLAKTYNQKSTIDRLMTEFTNLVKRLENYGIAHGDLQHGNIIVKNDKLYLIDYDGMYFPDLATLRVNELGHPNFQHPKRTANDYNKSIDRFSSIVIYTALKALTVAPNLWKKYDNGDNILFKGQDFANPLNSQLLKDLAGYSELSKLSNNLFAVSTWDFNKVPSLAEFISNTYQPPISITPSISVVRSAYTVIDGSQKGRLLEYLGQKVEVVGQISAHRKGFTNQGNPYIFLNFGVYPRQTFTIVIWSEALSELNANGIIPSSLVGKYVSITGVLSSYSGNPQIAIDYASQIQVLSGQSEVDLKLSLKTINVSNTKNTTNPKPPILSNKEADVFNDLYKNRPVSQPKINTPNRPTIPSYSTPSTSHSSSNTYKPSTSSSSSSSNNGCTVPIVVGIIGGIIGASIVEHFGGFIIGAVIGAIIGSGIKSMFD